MYLCGSKDGDKRTFMEVHKMPFRSYGQKLTDKFGVSWIFRGEKKNNIALKSEYGQPYRFISRKEAKNREDAKITTVIRVSLRLLN